jgi:hypothetical protein
MKILKVIGLILISLIVLKILFFGLGILHLAFVAIKLAILLGLIYIIAKALGFWK